MDFIGGKGRKERKTTSALCWSFIMQLKGGPFGYIDQSIFSSSNTAQSQLPDIEEMR